MGKSSVFEGLVTGIPELDVAREKAHAFARHFLRRDSALAFDVAEIGYEKFSNRWLAGRRDLGHAWLHVVIRREVASRWRRGVVALDIARPELELESRELPPPEALESKESRFVEWRERFAAIREELEAELKPDYVRLLACILGGGR